MQAKHLRVFKLAKYFLDTSRAEGKAWLEVITGLIITSNWLQHGSAILQSPKYTSLNRILITVA